MSGALVLWYVLTALSVAFMFYDLATNTPAMGVMKAAWVLIALYLGPFGLFVYLLACREPLPGTHDAYTAAHWKQSVGSLAHCLAGDATGIILAAILTYRFHFPNGIDLILEYAAAFAFGRVVFQAVFMKSMLGGNYPLALRRTLFAEFASMNMVMVGMLPAMVILMHLYPESHSPLGLAFWGVMSAATLAGAFTAYPINSWLVARHVKHGMMTARPKLVPMPAMAHMQGMPSQAAATLTRSAQAAVIAGTLAILAAAIYLTTRVAPIAL